MGVPQELVLAATLLVTACEAQTLIRQEWFVTSAACEGSPSGTLEAVDGSCAAWPTNGDLADLPFANGPFIGGVTRLRHCLCVRRRRGSSNRDEQLLPK